MSSYLSGRTSLTSVATDNLEDGAVTTAKIADVNVTTAKIADVNVTTGKVVDDAVTLAKLAPGTDGNLITYDASGNPAAVATGDSGQLLTSAGVGAPPAFATLSAGAWAEIEVQTIGSAVSAVTTAVSFGGAKSIHIIGEGFTNVTSLVELEIQIGDSGGLFTGAYYDHTVVGQYTPSTANSDGATNGTSMQITGASELTNNAGDFCCFDIWIFNADSTSLPAGILSNLVHKRAGNTFIGIGAGQYDDDLSAIDQFSVFASSGNLDAGRLTVLTRS